MNESLDDVDMTSHDERALAAELSALLGAEPVMALGDGEILVVSAAYLARLEAAQVELRHACALAIAAVEGGFMVPQSHLEPLYKAGGPTS